jgi:imidazolonepropionase-like amidohydrolase
MRHSFLLFCATLPTACLAQDLAINNARIIDDSGRVIENGSVLIRDDRIVAVGTAEQAASRMIDARRMTVMPGMIDTHVHLITGPAPDSHGCDEVIDHLDDTLAALLRRGFTTVLSPGDEAPDILTLRKRLADGDVLGPRLLAVGPVFSAPNHPGGQRQNFCDSAVAATDEGAMRARVRELSDANVDGIKIIYDSAWPPRPDDGVVAAITDEAQRRNVAVMAHVQTVDDALRAVQLGVDRLVHLPRTGSFDSAAMTVLRNAGVRVSSTVHLWAPVNGPNETKLDHGGRELIAQQLQQAEAGLAAVLANVRALWDAGIPIAFGTDAYRGENRAQDPIAHEIETLEGVLTPEEILAALTRNGAAFLGLSDQLGTLEPGKVADIVIIDGDPLADPSRLANVKVVIKAGEVVVDAR